MRIAIGIVMALFAASAQATAMLDCAAPPYYLSFVVDPGHGAQSFSFHQGAQLLAAGDMKEIKTFELKWPNRTVAAGNTLKIEAQFSPTLKISGQADGDKGKLLVNGTPHDLQCYWTN